VLAPEVEVDWAVLAAVCGRYGIAELKVCFGSRARGTALRGSDIDVR
jgi:uncharacterized protein